MRLKIGARVRLYFATGSWIHRTHPSAKLGLYAALVILLTVLPWSLYGPLFALLAVGLISTRVPWGHH